MKRVIRMITAMFMALCSGFCILGCDIQNVADVSTVGELYVDGKVLVDDQQVRIYPEERTAVIPVLTILEELGAQIVRTTNGENIDIAVTFHDYTFTFHTGESDLGVEIPNWMRDDPVWRKRYVRGVTDGELWIDLRSIAPLFYHGWGIRLRTNYLEMAVYAELLDPTELAYTEEELAKVNCRLIVDGQDITERNYAYINYEANNAEIPAVAVVKALGGDVEWVPCEPYPAEDRCLVYFHLNGSTHIYDTSKGDFGIGYLSGVEGLTRAVMGNDVIVDSVTFSGALFHIMGANLLIDYENAVIYVDTLQYVT